MFLAESGHGLITQYRVLDGNPADQEHVKPLLDRHQAIFDVAPDLYSSDRGFFNQENLQNCQTAGVTLPCIPQSGGQRAPNGKPSKRAGRSSEASDSVPASKAASPCCFVGAACKRALVEGRERFELFVGAAVLANNLMVIAALLRRKAAGGADQPHRFISSRIHTAP